MPGVALVTAYNDQGELLLGRRNDNGKWTVPGGHLEEGEEPRAAAARELYEETGLRPLSLSFLREFETAGGLVLYCFSAYVRGEPHSHFDPDDEVGEWRFVDVSEGLPSRFFNNLHGPGPESGDNLVTNLFDIEKADDYRPDLAKYEDPRLYTLDDVGLVTNEFGGDPSARDMIVMHAGHDRPMFRLVDHNVDELHTLPLTTASGPSKMEFLRRTPEAAEAPIVVGHAGAVLDGNHRVHLHRELGKQKVRGYQLVHDEGLQKAEPPPVDLGHGVADEHGVHFETGHPVSVKFVRGTTPAPNFGERFQQHIEPAGRYMVHNPDPGQLARGWEQGEVHFKNPLVLKFNHTPGGQAEFGYNDTSWKARLHRALGATGARLSRKVVGLGHDGIVTVDGDNCTREIVDLTRLHAQFGKAEERFDGGDMYVTYEFPSEDEAEAYHKAARDKYEDEWHGIGVTARRGRQVVVRAWNESNMDDFRHLVKKMGGKMVDAEGALDHLVAPEAFRKSEALVKMSVRSIPKGVEIPRNTALGEVPSYDYSHVLSPEHREQGYSLHVQETPGQSYEAQLFHHNKGVGEVIGDLNGAGTITPHSELDGEHRGKGLGRSMYEALYAHAFHSGVRYVRGGNHSQSASLVHESLARRHGLDYTPEWVGAEDDDTPAELGRYGYALKGELGYVCKSEPGEPDEVHKLLQHPDPVERRMALRLDSVRADHVARAALDPHPMVHEAAMDHPAFGELEGLALMNAKEGADGVYPALQQVAFLRRAGRARSNHIAAAVANATQVSPEARDAVLGAVVPHEGLSHDNIREIFHGPYASDDHRLALLGRDVDVPDDVLQSVARGVVAFPSEGASKLALAAFTHPLFSPADRDRFVTSIGETSHPSLVALAQAVLRAAPVGEPAAEQLHLHARFRPSPTTVGLLGAFLAGPGARPEDVDRALATGNHDLLGPASQSSAIQPQHFDQIVDRAGKAGDADLLASLQASPSFGNAHLGALMRPVAKSQLDQLVEMANHPVVDRQLGLDPLQIPAFRAARFLAGGRSVPAGAARAALYEDDGDVEAAALRAYGLEVTDDNRAALRAVADVGDFGKAEVDVTPNAQEILAAHPEGKDVAAAVARAYKNQFVVPVKLGGKHSKGSLLAHDDETDVTWLLKSGSGGAGVAAGSSEDPSNPNAREAAWYQQALAWGVADHYPRAEEISIDGHPYAALRLLPWRYQPLEKMRQKDPAAPARVLAPYLASGKLHEWAIMDYVFGNPDSHGGNVMADPTPVEGDGHERHRHFQHSDQPVDSTEDVQLIDHGSAYAGDEFDPAHDHASFVPFYLRAWAPHTNFNQLPLEDKLKYLPRVHGDVAKRLTTWIEGRRPDEVRVICQRYGIDPEPTLKRLEKLQALARTMPVDEAVDRLWATT